MPLNSLVYDPYFAALGGGELYACILAQELATDSMVTMLAPVPDLRSQLYQRFGLKLTKTRWVRHPKASMAEISRISREYDRFVCLTLTEPPFNQAPTGILVIQFPYGPRPPTRVLQSYQVCVCYSQYCQEWIKKLWGVDAVVLYPSYVGAHYLPTESRQNLVVSIGRFQADLNSKGYPALFAAFSRLSRDKMAGWEYYVIGGTGQSQRDRSYLIELEELATRARVKLLPDLARTELLQHLSRAKLLWHGAGYDCPGAPERAEHFGISIVEAMSAGVVPLVYAAGGPREIVEHKRTGFHWQNLIELGEFTSLVIRDEHLWQRFSNQARQAAAWYVPARLRWQFRELLGRIEQ